MTIRKSGARKKAPRSWRRIIDECIAKALGNSLRQQILWILNERIASPSEIAKELGESLSRVCNHVNVLKKAGCIELAYVRPVGNRLQHFYRANTRAFLSDLDWPRVPKSLRPGLRATLLRNVIDDSIEAVVEGTFDELEGSHLSWTPTILDEQGREEITMILERALLEVIAVQEDTKARLVASDSTGISYTISILGYPSVGGEKKVGPPTDAKELAVSKIESGSKAKKASKGRAAARKAKTRGKDSVGRATPKSIRKGVGN